jgi:hypothetical protein
MKRERWESLEDFQARQNAEEAKAGCSHGMPPSDIEPPSEFFEEQASSRASAPDYDTRRDEAVEAEIQAAQNMGGQPEPELVKLEIGQVYTPATLPTDYETEGLSFEVRIEDVVEMRLRHPGDCIHPGELEQGVFRGWPTVYLDKETGLLVLESCWGWSSGEDRIFCKAVRVQSEHGGLL